MGVSRLFIITRLFWLELSKENSGVEHVKTSFAPLFYFCQNKKKRSCIKMKEAKGTIRMAGERMEVLIDAGCVQSCKPAVARALPVITGLLCRTLKRRDVARQFIQNVRIGDTVVLIDRQTGYTYRLQMQVHSVCVLEIYQQSEKPRETAQQAVYILNGAYLWAVSDRKAAA
jgi:hypothetical protein